MLSRSVLSGQARRIAGKQCAQLSGRRGLAAPASGSFQYETGTAAGVKFASRDVPGPTTQLAIVSKAGTRYEPLPGLTIGLQNFAFKSTERRSTIRLQRESELLGADIYARHSRESLIVGAKFLRDDLPYFAELLAEVVGRTKYIDYVYNEEIEGVVKLQQKKFLGDVNLLASNSAYGLAFHRGLGTPLYPASSAPLKKYLSANTISAFSSIAYAKPNFAVVANGADSAELSKWINEFFPSVREHPEQEIPQEQTKYFGGEERISHGSGNAMVIAFPGSSSFTGGFYKPEISVLAELLGGQTTIKWSSGFSLLSKVASKYPGATIRTKSDIHSDAGLLTISLTGNANDMRKASSEIVDTIKAIADGVGKEDFQKAKALAKFKELEFGQNVSAGLELTGSGLVHGNKAYQIDEVAKKIDAVTEEQVKSAAKTILEHKASVSSVGDLYALPYAEEIGLKV
ncbi:Cytochrome b-c1 complex subunit 2, mitochondrial [Sphaceloma murrayae]|uniref:Cytochrome b-c1 complex subunit 2, mitochondrial n=1 Tax=Sphaceloma murrayae TaxID=2082308 RepID=A0A2K1QHV5_9PEZI|nr:Cytochrome b-c1 complex subunit 2, mitochondrial [Sphaceloma murrayae]